MNAQELRSKYLEFFENKGHSSLPSAPLVPENDPTVLFTTAGMHPLVPFLLGEKHPSGNRLANCQKCVRTGDIEEVGDTTHLTFFEMLGNWSLGDYFKKESIEYSYEFLTKELGIPVEKIAVSCFDGDDDAPKDTEAAQIWSDVSGGKLDNRIDFLPKSKNWWGPAGQTGPCGPDTEIFIWMGEGDAPEKITPGDLAKDGIGWVEVWNNVFMQYDKTAEGTYEPLNQQNVDTGMGLERMLAVMQGVNSVYETDLFVPILEKIKEIASEEDEKSLRLIADHIRSAVMILGDGVLPGKEGQGYVLRRLIRMAVRKGQEIGILKNFTKKIGEIVVDIMGEAYPEIKKPEVLNELELEEVNFRKTLEDGTKQFEKVVEGMSKGNQTEISGRMAFKLYDTYGFPIEITSAMAELRGLTVDTKGFKEAYEKHQELSRTASAGAFKGGLQDDSEATANLHTATHLLLAALKKFVSPEIHQRGSNITADRLRFDFNHEEPLTDEQKKVVEDQVNEWIEAKLPISVKEMKIEEAKESGAEAQFTEKYGEKVKVYHIGEEGNMASIEVCGGPHAKNTGDLGKFRIKKEQSSSRGVRRIKAVLEK